MRAETPFHSRRYASGSEVVAFRGSEVEEVLGDGGADCVRSGVFGAGSAETIAVETCRWVLGERS